MDGKTVSSRWVYVLITATLDWFAMIHQFITSVPLSISEGQTVAGAVITWFSYFTMLTHLMVAITFTAIVLAPTSKLARYGSKAPVQTAIAVYITIVALVYNLILRGLWHPTGLFRLADELLHVVIPALYIIYWVTWTAKEDLKWIHIFSWLLFPFFYLIYILIRGAVTGRYPYPFMDVSKFGYIQILLNHVVLLFVFLFWGAFYVAVGKFIVKKLS